VAYPWLRFLPEDAVEEFLNELVEVSRASSDLDAIAPIQQIVAEWQHTAEVYSAPELYRVLSAASHGIDHGQAPVPKVGE
jgi:hypothetical protein